MVRDSILSILVRMTSAALIFLTGLILARMLGAESYGRYAFAVSLATMLTMISQLGLPQLLVRETSRRIARFQFRLLRNLWQWSGVAATLGGLFLSAACLVLLALVGDRISGEYREVLVPAAILVPLVTYAACLSAVLRGMNHTIAGQTPEFVAKPLMLLILLYLGNRLWGPLSSGEAMWMHVGAALATFIVCLALVVKHRPAFEFPARRINGIGTKWFYSALPIACISGLQMANNQADVLMLGAMETAAAVGIYKVAISLSALIALGLQAVNMVVAPRFSRYYSLNQTARLQRVVTLSSWAVMLVALPSAVVFYGWGPWILRTLFGPEYVSAHQSLNILVIGQLLNASVGLVGSLLIMSGREKESLRALVLALSSNVVLNAVLIPEYGMEGAAFSSAISMIVWNLYMWSVAKYRLNIQTCGFVEAFRVGGNSLRSMRG